MYAAPIPKPARSLQTQTILTGSGKFETSRFSKKSILALTSVTLEEIERTAIKDKKERKESNGEIKWKDTRGNKQ